MERGAFHVRKINKRIIALGRGDLAGMDLGSHG